MPLKPIAAVMINKAASTNIAISAARIASPARSRAAARSIFLYEFNALERTFEPRANSTYGCEEAAGGRSGTV
jgi:hypothetical protein